MDIIICYLLIYFIEAAIFIIYCKSNLKARYSSKSYEFLMVILGYLLIFAFSLFRVVLVNCVMFLLINWCLIYYLYRTRIITAAFHASLLTALMGMCELIADSALLHFAYNFFSDADIINISIFATVSKLLYFIVVILVSFFINRNQKDVFINNAKISSEELFLLIIPIFSAFIMTTFAMISYTLEFPVYLDTMVSLSSFLILATDICVFGFYKYSKTSQQRFYELQLQLQKESDTTKYNKLLLSQYENQRILIHDIKQHLSTISYLNTKAENERIDKYISYLLNSSNLKESVKFCENSLLNAIISRYRDKADELKISFHVDIRSTYINQLSEESITSLFCNLLDNSIEAASKINNSFIELTISDNDTSPLATINVVNSCKSSPFSTKTGRLITQKANPLIHGIGVKSIGKIVQSYSGDMTMYFNEEDYTFHTIIGLPKM